MNGLKVIKNNLVPVYETSSGEKVVYGSELHESLGAPSVYREWIKRRISDIDAVENEDFQAVEISTPSGQTRKDHIIKLDTAKEMAMLEKNEKGKQVRNYFIAVEKKYNHRQVPMTVPEQIQLLAMGSVELNQKITDVKQDLDNFKMYMTAEKAVFLLA